MLVLKATTTSTVKHRYVNWIQMDSIWPCIPYIWINIREALPDCTVTLESTSKGNLPHPVSFFYSSFCLQIARLIPQKKMKYCQICIVPSWRPSFFCSLRLSSMASTTDLPPASMQKCSKAFLKFGTYISLFTLAKIFLQITDHP